MKYRVEESCKINNRVLGIYGYVGGGGGGGVERQNYKISEMKC